MALIYVTYHVTIVSKGSGETINGLKGESTPAEDQSSFRYYSGGMYEDLRLRSVEEMLTMDFPGYGIGGLSVGEPKELMYEVLNVESEYARINQDI